MYVFRHYNEPCECVFFARRTFARARVSRARAVVRRASCLSRVSAFQIAAYAAL